MSNGYLVAAAADLALAHEIADGFALEVIDASAVHDRETTSAALAGAANVGLLLSLDAANDEAFAALLAALAVQLPRAQLIVLTPEARAAFAGLPETWPVMSIEEARTRAQALARQREQTQAPTPPPHAAPLPPSDAQVGDGAEVSTEASPGETPSPEPEAPADAQSVESNAGEAELEDALAGAGEQESAAREGAGADGETISPEPEMPPVQDPARAAEHPAAVRAPEPPHQTQEPEAPPLAAPAPAAPDRTSDRWAEQSDLEMARRTSGATAPADATAFAPSKLRRGTPELVRIVVHQPKDLNAVIKAAKKIDPRTEAAPQGMGIGNVALGASIGVALEVRGGACEGTVQRRLWLGEPIDFNFAVEADANVKQVVMLARVFVDDAQIGVLAFTRKVSGPAKKPHGLGDRARLKRHKRVFLSYSSQDRETVAQIATAYQIAGVEHFWDRASLKSGEEWSPRLRREIDRADLFHLCWSKSAAQSAWVAKEAEHALTRRRKHSGKPDITVQMLDGPPWAPHPPELDSINFDDFVRAAIVGYARGDGS